MYQSPRSMRPPCQPFNQQMSRPSPSPRPPSCPWHMSQNQPPPRGFRPQFTNRPPPPRQNNNFFGPGNGMFGAGPTSCPAESFPFSSPPPPLQHPQNFQNPPPGHQPLFNQSPGHQLPRPQLSFHQQQHPQYGRGGGQFRGRGRGMQNGQGFRGGFRGQGQAGNPGQQGGNNNNTAKKQRKEKVDKRDLAENNVFYCDTCDRGFKTEEKYMEHVAGHQKCSYQDCPYIAAPKLVQLHENLQHRQGYAKKIYGLESAEDIAKWREERKKNFPTSENIDRKKKEYVDRASRGEVIETKDFSKMRRGRGRGRQNGGSRGRGHWGELKQTQDSGEMDEDVSPTEVKIQRPKPKDTKDELELLNSLMHDDNTSSSRLGSAHGDNTSSSRLGLAHIDQTSSSQPLASTITSPSEHPKSGQHTELLSQLQQALSTATDNNLAAAQSLEEEESDGKAPKRKRKWEHKNKKNKQLDKKAKKQKQPEPLKRKYTLLEKLLAPEIRRERNKILQCVHHVVKQNFFGEQNTEHSAPS